MSTVHDYSLTPVHAHINLLGWRSLTLAGIIYHLFPSVGKTRLALGHFWLHNIGLPLMMIGLAFAVHRNDSYLIATIIGANVTVLGVLLFVINILKNLKQPVEAG